jgi:N-acetylated-alpha-linked acidic dipeptidase
VFEAWKSSSKGENPPIGTLGSGSDYVAFLDHVGITSLSMAFKGDYGVYHSNYDSFYWMEKFGDPQFLYHQTLCKFWGLLTLRLSDSPIIPLYPTDYTNELSKYVDSLSKNFAPHTFPVLEQAVAKLEKTSSLKKVNNRLTYFERGFLSEEGIKGREWFKHVVYAPGVWTGYSSQEFPAIVEALEGKDYGSARHAEDVAAEAIRQAAKNLKADYD